MTNEHPISDFNEALKQLKAGIPPFSGNIQKSRSKVQVVVLNLKFQETDLEPLSLRLLKNDKAV